MSRVYEKSFVIQFSHCDPTGLVFHSNFFTWAVDTEENFFNEVVGENVFGPGVNDGLYTPMAGIRAEFKSPVWARDKVKFRLWIDKLGKRSVRWFFCIVKNDAPAVWITETLVFTHLQEDGSFVSVDIPERIKRKLEPYVRTEREPWQVFRTE